MAVAQVRGALGIRTVGVGAPEAVRLLMAPANAESEQRQRQLQGPFSLLVECVPAEGRGFADWEVRFTTSFSDSQLPPCVLF